MKKYYLLQLYPVGNFQSANKVINETESINKQIAINLFQNVYHDLQLDETGYAKHGKISYCVAEQAY